jgi:hypothetical protein
VVGWGGWQGAWRGFGWPAHPARAKETLPCRALPQLPSFAAPAAPHLHPPPQTGTPDELKEEAARLRALSLHLDELNYAEVRTPVAPSDAGGALLGGLKRLRRLRMDAIEKEIERLEKGFKVNPEDVKKRAREAATKKLREGRGGGDEL